MDAFGSASAPPMPAEGFGESEPIDYETRYRGREPASYPPPPPESEQYPVPQQQAGYPPPPPHQAYPPPQQQQQQQAYYPPPPPQQVQHPPPPYQATHLAPPHNDRPWERYGVTQDEYDYMTSLFINFDDDDGGDLDRPEVTRLAKWLNYPSTEADITEMFRTQDTDRSGTLSMEEFLAFYMDKRPDPEQLYGLDQRTYNTALLQFRSVDPRLSGYLDLAAFTQLAKKQQVVASDAEAAGLFAQIDSDQNGVIDLHEFLSYMKPFRG